MTGRPTKGRPVRFAPGDGATREPRPDVVTGLRFTIEPSHGGAVRVDVVDLEPRPLALAFAAALRRSCEPGGAIGAASVVKQHLLAIRRFCGFLRETAPAILSPADLRGAHVDDFEGALEAAGMRPIHRHTVLGKVLGSLRDIAADRPESLDPGLVERLAYTSARSAGRSQPRDAYSPGVARRLRDAAREDVARLFRRLGDRPYAQSDRELRDAAATVDAVIAAERAIPHDHPDWRVFYMIHHERGMTAAALIDEAHGRHHLLAADLAPLLTLLSLETGLEIECCKALTADCLADASAGTVTVAYEKRRARGAERKSIRVRDGGVGTPGGLIRRLIDATAAARRHLGSDRLWVYHSWGRLRAGFGIGAPPTAPWVARHGLVDDDSRPLRLQLSRLRKTHKALWYLKTGGEIARFAVGHTPEVATRCYADVPALRALHEATVTDAFAEAVAAARPVVLTPEHESAARADPDCASDLMEPAGVAALLDGEQDVWLAACANFYASPWGDAGEPCPQPFWTCLECRNAVVTARKLPAILAFRAFVEAERGRLGAEDWRHRFARAHARIVEQILPAFSPATIAAAQAEAVRAALYLPPEVRA